MSKLRNDTASVNLILPIILYAQTAYFPFFKVIVHCLSARRQVVKKKNPDSKANLIFFLPKMLAAEYID